MPFFFVLSGIKGCEKSDGYGSENTQPIICRDSRQCCIVGYQNFGGIRGLHEVSCQPKETGGKIFTEI
jgi:hypothetical protein